jgi:hypothetical protein
MLVVDLLLAAGAAALAGACLPATVPPRAPLRWLPPAGVAYGLGVSLLLALGLARSHPSPSSARPAASGPRYGTRLPDFSLAMLDGGRLTPSAYAPRWRLWVFVRPGCAPCRSELAELAPVVTRWRAKLAWAVIVPGRPALARPEAMAARLVPGLPPHTPVALDPDESLTSRLLGQPFNSPTSILVDPAGVVRHVQIGRRRGPGSLAVGLDALLAGRPYTSQDAAREAPYYGRPAMDGELVIDGRPIHLTRLSAGRTVVVRFGPPPRSSAAAERGAPPAVPTFWVVPSVPGRPAPVAAAGRTVALDPNGWLTAAYLARRGPRTAVLREGRLLYYSSAPAAASDSAARVAGASRHRGPAAGGPAEQPRVRPGRTSRPR